MYMWNRYYQATNLVKVGEVLPFNMGGLLGVFVACVLVIEGQL